MSNSISSCLFFLIFCTIRGSECGFCTGAQGFEGKILTPLDWAFPRGYLAQSVKASKAHNSCSTLHQWLLSVGLAYRRVVRFVQLLECEWRWFETSSKSHIDPLFSLLCSTTLQFPYIPYDSFRDPPVFPFFPSVF